MISNGITAPYPKLLLLLLQLSELLLLVLQRLVIPLEVANDESAVSLRMPHNSWTHFASRALWIKSSRTLRKTVTL